jgi:hypothetical protein
MNRYPSTITATAGKITTSFFMAVVYLVQQLFPQPSVPILHHAFKPPFLDNWATVDFMPKYAGTDLLTSREKHFNSTIIG